MYTSEYLEQLNDLKNLNDPSNIDRVKIEYEDCLQEGSPDDCAQFYLFLSEIIQASRSADSELVSFSQRGLDAMAFRGFIALGEKDQIAVLEHRLLEAIKNGVDVENIIRSHIEAFPYDKQSARDLLQGFAKNLEQNSEELGNVPVDIGGKKYFPQVKYWIQDYLNFPTKSAKRGNLDRINYLNQSGNATKLTQVQKQQLLAVLKMYDQLLNPPEAIEKKEQEAKTHEITKTVEEEREPMPVGYVSMMQNPQPQAEMAQKQAPTREEPLQINIDQRLQDLKNRIQK